MNELLYFYIYGGYWLMTSMPIIFIILGICIFKLSKMILKKEAFSQTHNLFRIVQKGRYSILVLMIAGTIFSSSRTLHWWNMNLNGRYLHYLFADYYINISASITGILFFTILTVWLDALRAIDVAIKKDRNVKLLFLVMKMIFGIFATALLMYAFNLFSETIDVVAHAKEPVKLKLLREGLASIFHLVGLGTVFIGFSILINSYLNNNREIVH
jgi:hypothetical protein